MVKYFNLFLLLILAGCSKYFLTVRQISVTPNSLASSHVGSPDPRQNTPPVGQKLVIDWVIPSEILTQEPKVVLSLVFKNHTEVKKTYPIYYRSGYVVYTLLDEEFYQTGGLLTYRAEIVTGDGEVYRDWKHQLWVSLIHLEDIAVERPAPLPASAK